jgi:hypothetical protein
MQRSLLTRSSRLRLCPIKVAAIDREFLHRQVVLLERAHPEIENMTDAEAAQFALRWGDVYEANLRWYLDVLAKALTPPPQPQALTPPPPHSAPPPNSAPPPHSAPPFLLVTTSPMRLAGNRVKNIVIDQLNVRAIRVIHALGHHALDISYMLRSDSAQKLYSDRVHAAASYYVAVGDLIASMLPPPNHQSRISEIR